jgi:hypothetical protein
MLNFGQRNSVYSEAGIFRFFLRGGGVFCTFVECRDVNLKCTIIFYVRVTVHRNRFIYNKTN